MNIIDQIKSQVNLETYVETITGFNWKQVGIWKRLQECPFCCGHDCFSLSSKGTIFCFQCGQFIGDAIKFKSVYKSITYKAAIEEFCQELNIKKWDKKDVDWVSIRESACDYLQETLFGCNLTYRFRDKEYTPLQYMTDYRKHSHEIIMQFRVGFNDGNLITHLKKKYDKDAIKASGIETIPEGAFTYPMIVDGEIKYFRIKDPNKIKKWQMPLNVRSKGALWLNQDTVSNGMELWCVEGEDDAVTLADCGVPAVASCGTLTVEQVNFLKKFEFSCLYLCFDNDAGGKTDTNLFSRTYKGNNMLVVPVPENKDIDELLRDAENKEQIIQDLKVKAIPPTEESKSIITQKPDGYYIEKYLRDGTPHKHRLTNWIFDFEAVIISGDTRIRKGKIKSANVEGIINVPAEVLASVNKFREFLYGSCNRFMYFSGMDNDLNALVQYWEIKYNPKIVYESDCVGEIEQGFIAENIFVSNTGEFRPLTNGFLSLNDKESIKIVEFVKKGNSRSELPYFPLTEPEGGIEKFKEHIFETMIKNRNLKIAVGIGWTKAVLWSNIFFDTYRYFPLLMFHGKFAGGKSCMAQWLMSMIGLRDCNPEMISDRGTTEVGLARKLDYYSCLPVFVDDYRADENGMRFHTFFRGVFNRTSPTKGLREDQGVRRVRIRGCLLITGEHTPTDPALLSRLISVELTKTELNSKYFKDLIKIEPKFAGIGLSWLKEKTARQNEFMNRYEALYDKLTNEFDEPRQAGCWAVCLAGALTEPYFQKQEKELTRFFVNLAKKEIEERKNEEIMNILWEATDVIHKRGKLDRQALDYSYADQEVYLHLPSLLGAINAEPSTRSYVSQLPNNKEIAKILKQEPYIKEQKNVKIEGKQAQRWVLDLSSCPEILRNIFITDDLGRDGDDI